VAVLTVLEDDGDFIRGLGYVTMYSAWTENDVDDMLCQLDSIKSFDENKQAWPISRKLKHAAKLVRKLDCVELNELPDTLEKGIELFNKRNLFIHGTISLAIEDFLLVKPGRPKEPLKKVTSKDYYDLANEFCSYRVLILDPMYETIPRAVLKCTGVFPKRWC
jgi:hypothetical protein